MGPHIILQGITIEQLLQKIEILLEKRLNAKLEQLKPKASVKYLTRKEVAAELHVSMVTIHKWINEGYLESYRIGRRILFKTDEIQNALKQRNSSFLR